MSLSPKNYSTVSTWFNRHHNLGGSVHLVTDTIPLIGSPETYLNDIYSRFAQLTFEDVEFFMTQPITDNSMPHRALIEDAAKLYYLEYQARNNNLIFKPQLLHEPWANRYRVHPGSGRIATMWKCDPTTPIESIYIHFNEPSLIIPTASRVLTTPGEFLDAITYSHTDNIDFTVESAFNRTERDAEWKPNITCDIDWEFIRYSEGEYFLGYKRAWRDHALDLWLLLNH